MGVCDDSGLEGRASSEARSCVQVFDMCVDVRDDRRV